MKASTFGINAIRSCVTDEGSPAPSLFSTHGSSPAELARDVHGVAGVYSEINIVIRQVLRREGRYRPERAQAANASMTMHAAE